MGNQNINVKINQFSVFAPVIGAELTGAVYSCLVLHQLRGDKIADTEVIERVMNLWSVVTTALASAKPPNETEAA